MSILITFLILVAPAFIIWRTKNINLSIFIVVVMSVLYLFVNTTLSLLLFEDDNPYGTLDLIRSNPTLGALGIVFSVIALVNCLRYLKNFDKRKFLTAYVVTIAWLPVFIYLVIALP